MSVIRAETEQHVNEAIARHGGRQRYVLQLFVAGGTRRSTQAIENVRRICREYLKDSYRLEVIDIYQQPALAQAQQIVAAPTLVREAPLPERRVVGNLADAQRLLAGLGLCPRGGPPARTATRPQTP